MKPLRKDCVAPRAPGPKDRPYRRFDLEKKQWDEEQGLADEGLESALDQAMFYGLGEA